MEEWKMNKKELKAWLDGLENLGDDDSIDEEFSKTELVKKLKDGTLTLENFKAKMSDGEFKSFIDSLKDTHFNTALETWKKNHLQKLIDDAVSKANPQETEEQKMIRELRERIEKTEAESAKKDLRAKAIQIANDKKVPLKLVDYFLGQDEETTTKNFNSFNEIFNSSLSSAIEEKLKGGYKPPTGDPTPPVDESKMSDAEWFAAHQSK
jgi:hypothetical protein